MHVVHLATYVHVDFSSPVSTRKGSVCGPSPPAVEAEIVHM